MIMLGCLNIRQASRSLDLRIFLVIAAALAMGIALEETGAARMIADGVVAFASPYGTLAVLSAIFPCRRHPDQSAQQCGNGHSVLASGAGSRAPA
jgi:hypothetical protein